MAIITRREFSRSSVIYIIFGIALICVMTLIGASAFLRVNYFVVNSSGFYTTEQIIEASGVSGGDNLLYLNTQTVSQNIKNELPFVNNVEIVKNLPDTLIITVTESNAVAYLLFEGDTIIIDSSGRVLERTQHLSNAGSGASVTINNKKLIEIRGVLINDARVGRQLRAEPGLESILTTMQNVLVAMEREGITNDVDYLDVSNINNIYFGYKGIYRIIVGGIADLRVKLNRLAADIQRIQEVYPNSRGVYNMTDDPNRYKFTPE